MTQPTGALSREQCLHLLSGVTLGRVVFTAGAMPAVVPVAFAVLGGMVVCRTETGSRLAVAAEGGVLALQADRIDLATASGWSVVATGVAEIVRDLAECARIASRVPAWGARPLDVAVRLPPTVLTGWQLARG